MKPFFLIDCPESGPALCGVGFENECIKLTGGRDILIETEGLKSVSSIFENNRRHMFLRNFWASYRLNKKTPKEIQDLIADFTFNYRQKYGYTEYIFRSELDEHRESFLYSITTLTKLGKIKSTKASLITEKELVEMINRLTIDRSLLETEE